MAFTGECFFYPKVEFWVFTSYGRHTAALGQFFFPMAIATSLQGSRTHSWWKSVNVWVSPALTTWWDQQTIWQLGWRFCCIHWAWFLDAFSWPWASSPVSLALFKIPTGLFGRKKKKYTDQLESHEYGTQKRCEELKFLIQTGQLYRWWLQRGWGAGPQHWFLLGRGGWVMPSCCSFPGR